MDKQKINEDEKVKHQIVRITLFTRSTDICDFNFHRELVSLVGKYYGPLDSSEYSYDDLAEKRSGITFIFDKE